MKKFLHVLTASHCFIPATNENHKIITIAKILFDVQCMLHVPVKFIEIDVRKYLARDIADSDASQTFDGTLSLRSDNPDLLHNYRSLL